LNQNPTIKDIFWSFLRLGLTAFGGPAMVAYIRELAVTRHQWLDEADFKNGVALCQSIPGATAIQTAAYAGLRAHGVAGAAAAYVGFGLPAFLSMLLLSILYVRFNDLPRFISLFNGLQVIVVAIVLQAVISFGRNVANNYKSILFALLAALLFWFGLSPFTVILGAGAMGIVAYREPVLKRMVDSQSKETPSTARKLTLILVVFLLCIAGLYLLDYRLFDLGKVMLKIDLFAFGGGFGSLPLMLHEVVSARGWLDSKTFMDGIALGQVTPGPIIITATFVGFLLYGLSGAIIATVSIFTPSFLILIVSAPFFDRLKDSTYFLRAIDGIFASFVGLLVYVCIKFAIAVPWDFMRIALGLASFIALLRKLDIIYVVFGGAVISMIIF
jgi:chromate transporter